MLPVAGGLLLIFVMLGLIGYQKTARTASAWAAIAKTLERSTRTVALFAAVPAIAIALWLIGNGIDPPAALIVAVLAGAGVWGAALGLLRMEGILVETESDALARQTTQQPPPSSPRGRGIAVAVGVLLVGVALWTLTLVR